MTPQDLHRVGYTAVHIEHITNLAKTSYLPFETSIWEIHKLTLRRGMDFVSKYTDVYALCRDDKMLAEVGTTLLEYEGGATD